jgi:ATP-dependent helicase IRC3
MADRQAGNADVVVASVQTVGRGNDRILQFPPRDFGRVIIDEAHHSVAASYGRVINHFLDGNPRCFLTGFTATPNRADGEALGQVFEEIVFQYGIREGIKDGWLCDVRGYRIRTATSLEGVSTRAGDYAQGELADVVDTPERNKLIVKEWITLAYPRQTIAFCVTVAHAQNLALAFQQAGVPAQAVWGGDPDRRAKLAAFRSGELKVLTNVQLLTEGFDMWQVACVILARPTKSQTVMVQQVGRGTRLQEGIENLVQWLAELKLKPGDKVDCLVLDVVDATGRHSLVTLPSLFGMGEKLDLSGRSVFAALSEIEAVQAAHPTIDLSGLDDISKLRTYVEEANLWQVRFAEETEGISKLRWRKTLDGSFIISLPGNEAVYIREDLLGKFNVTGVIQGSEFNEPGNTSLESALMVAELNLSLRGKSLMTLLKKEATWHKKPLSVPQLRQLRRFKVPEARIAKMNSGEASALIGQLLLQERQGKNK